MNCLWSWVSVAMSLNKKKVCERFIRSLAYHCFKKLIIAFFVFPIFNFLVVLKPKAVTLGSLLCLFGSLRFLSEVRTGLSVV